MKDNASMMSVEFSTLGPTSEDHGAYSRGYLAAWQAEREREVGHSLQASDTVEPINTSMSRVTRRLSDPAVPRSAGAFPSKLSR